MKSWPGSSIRYKRVFRALSETQSCRLWEPFGTSRNISTIYISSTSESQTYHTNRERLLEPSPGLGQISQFAGSQTSWKDTRKSAVGPRPGRRYPIPVPVPIRLRPPNCPSSHFESPSFSQHKNLKPLIRQSRELTEPSYSTAEQHTITRSKS